MAKIKILLADADEKYLMPLEYKLVSELDDAVDIQVITQREYLEFFFGEPHVFDIALINERWFDEKYKNYDIANIFILSEDHETYEKNIYIYKYTSVNEIYNYVMSSLDVTLKDNFIDDETKIWVCYSPVGGVGTTTIAAGAAKALAKMKKRVLFIGTDNLQSFTWIMHNVEYVESGFENKLLFNSECDVNDIKRNISKEGMDIFKPFLYSLTSLNINAKDLVKIIRCMKEIDEYDYIIVDTASNFDESISLMMSIADNVLILIGQDEKSALKMECLIRNINCSDDEKFYFVCNKYDDAKENALLKHKKTSACIISDYIPYEDDMDKMSIDDIASLKSMQKLALLL